MLLYEYEYLLLHIYIYIYMHGFESWTSQLARPAGLVSQQYEYKPECSRTASTSQIVLVGTLPYLPYLVTGR